jgi:hypothetical protein
VIYSHSDNSDIWAHLSESISKISNKYKKYIAVEAGSHCDLSEFTKVIEYDDSDMYDKKLHTIFSHVDTQYVVLIHDNDLIVNFDNDLFDRLLQSCMENKIDRCMFGVVAKDVPIKVSLGEDHTIGKINNISTPHFYTPYDVGPSIWRVDAYKAALATAPNTHYRDIELSAVKQYCISNLNMYAFLSHPVEKSYYVIGRPFYHKFQFLHIFVRRQLLEEHLYMDQQENFRELLVKYPKIKERGILTGQNHINIKFRTV